VRESYKPGANDYNDLVQKLLTANVELIYIGGYAFEAGSIIRQMRDFASPAILVGGDALLVEQFWATSGTSGESTLVTFAPDALKLNSARAVIEAFKTTDYNPEGYTLHAYAAVQAFAQAATATRSVDGRALSQWLRAGNSFNTVWGPCRLMQRAIKEPSFAWYKWSQGTYAETPPFPFNSEHAMKAFFVQIKCELGKSYAVATAIADAEIASEIYSTAGAYDLMVKFYLEDSEDVGRFVSEKLQPIAGIRDTTTMITFRAF
jgi:DNA-binding Lrp family transcriptional regulator